MMSNAHFGFEYHFQCFGPDGKLKWEFTEHNLLPNEGRDYILTTALLGGAGFASWYIGLYEGSYVPQVTDTMATFPAAATETTAYNEVARPVLTPDALSNGTYINGASAAVFTFNAAKTIRGGFISSGSVKGGTTGVLLSAVLATSPKVVAVGDQLKVTAGVALATV